MSHSETGPDASQPNIDGASTSPILGSTGAQRKPTVSVVDDPTRQPTSFTRRRSRKTTGNTTLPDRETNMTPLQRFKSRFVPVRPVGQAPGVWTSCVAIARHSWLNVLLIFIPLSFAFHFATDNDVIIFVFSFLAIIPLAKLLGFATEELALRVGQTIGGLLNATLGNAVELIVSIIALTQCQLKVVQSSLVGSILSNLLLVLGMCFFAGGVRYSEQGFAYSAAQVNSSLLVTAVIAVLLPAAFFFAIAPSGTGDNPSDFSSSVDPDLPQDVLKMSRGVSILLLITYVAYLVFQLWSHKNLYEDDFEGNFQSTRYESKEERRKRKADKKSDGEDPVTPVTPTSPAPTSPANGDVEKASSKEEEEEEIPQLSVVMAVVLLVIDTVLVAFTSEWLVDSIDGLTEKGGISKEFVGLILLPIVGNAAEHVTAVTVSIKDKLTLSIGVAVGSSIQIALFVIPFVTIIAWIIGKPLSLLFDPFESIALFLAVITVNYATADGKSNWLEGAVLFNLYVIIATTIWFYPGKSLEGLFGITDGKC